MCFSKTTRPRRAAVVGRRFSAIALAVAVIGLLLPSAVAQMGGFPGLPQQPPMNGPQPTVIQLDHFEADGAILAVAMGRQPALQLQTVTDQIWTVYMDNETDLHVRGLADKSILKTGMFISFTAEFDRKGKPQHEIGALTIVTIRKGMTVGAFPSAAAADNEFMGGNNFGMQPQPPPQTQYYTVTGRITSLRSGKKMVVHFGQGSVSVELAEAPRIMVDVADLSIVSRGDRVSATGYSPPNQTQTVLQTGRGVAKARSVEIELAGTLGQKKPPVVPPNNPRANPGAGPNAADPNNGQPQDNPALNFNNGFGSSFRE